MSEGMQVYLVGGAVRDELLGLPVRDRDWVVVGTTPEAMLAQGYRAVGRDFPVFLHPETGEEYALARTERKAGTGHQGFVFHADPSVTLEQDLLRRDLTVNAIARAADGELIDPYGGRADLEARVLRHVSEAFDEDPLRVLRVARYAARFAAQGFGVADGTRERMGRMSASGELAALSAERVWRELDGLLATDSPAVGLELLRETGALAALLPEVDALFGVPQPERWHPEVDTGLHMLMTVTAAAALSPEPAVRFAAMVHDLGKALTPEQDLPSHHGHDHAGVPLVEALCARLKVPGAYRDLGVLASREHIRLHQVEEARPGTLVDLLLRCDALRRPERFELLLEVCHADLRGRTGREDVPYPQRARLEAALAAIAGVDHAALDLSEDAEARVREARIAAVTEALA